MIHLLVLCMRGATDTSKTTYCIRRHHEVHKGDISCESAAVRADGYVYAILDDAGTTIDGARRMDGEDDDDDGDDDGEWYWTTGDGR